MAFVAALDDGKHSFAVIAAARAGGLPSTPTHAPP
jgi:hypothetical protein